MNNILVVNINWLGDAIFSTPVFKALKKIYPQAKITCLCVPRVKDVLDYCPYVDRIIVYDEKGKHRMPWQKLKLIHQLSRQKFDTAFLLHRSMTRALIVFLAGIPRRIGFSKTKALLTLWVKPLGEEAHRSDGYLHLLEGFGLKIDDRVCELRLKLEDMQSIDRLLTQYGIGEGEDFIVLNAGGNWPLKRWPAKSFVQLAKTIYEKYGLKTVLPGGKVDIDASENIAKQAGGCCVVLAGKTTLGQSLALYKRSRLVISSDTGPLHLAHSVGADVMGVFGPTRPSVTGPRGSGRSTVLFKDIGCNKAPCYHLACADNVCMQAISVEDVMHAIQASFS